MKSFSKLVKKNPLFFAFLLPALTDGFVTLLGQTSGYWAGKGTVNEASPAVYFLLASPWVYLLGSLLWFAFWYWAFKHLKEPFNLFLMFVFVAGHFWGSAGWIKKFFLDKGIYSLDNHLTTIMGWSLIVIYLFVIAAIATYSLRVYLNNRRN